MASPPQSPTQLDRAVHPQNRRFLTTQSRFIHRFEDAFTTRWNGLSWPNAERTFEAAEAYFRALPVPGKNKTMKTLSISSNLPEDRLQHFITDSAWDHEGVQAQLTEDLPPEVKSPDAILQVDGVPILKDGKKSAGVQRQWAGNVGKVANSQHAVDLTLTVPGKEINANQVTYPLGMELYLPEKWLTDPAFADRREDARMPDELPFRKKPEIALDLIERAREAAVPHACIGADSEFGDSRAFRAQLREWNEPYVLEVTASELRVIPEDTPIEAPEEYDGPGPTPTVSRYPEEVSATSPTAIAAELEDDEAAWTEESWTEGTKGRQFAEFVRRRVRIVTDTQRRAVSDETGWLLIQRREGELKAWLCWGVDDWQLKRLVLYAHQRWTIEHVHREIKQFLGMNEFEGRTWSGWHRHITMVLLAYAFLSRERARIDPSPAERLPPLSELARAARREVCIQEAMKEHDIDREFAEEMTATYLRVLFAET